MLLRRPQAVAAWSALPATRGAAVQGAWRLFLSRVLRKSRLREPAPEQEGTGVSAGLSDQAAARRLPARGGCHPKSAARREAEGLRAPLRQDQAIGMAARRNPRNVSRFQVDCAARN